jgi:two-component system, LuxR family, sensor kinase FixL
MIAGLENESRNALQRGQACLEMLAFRLGGRPDALGLLAGIQAAQDDLHRLYEEVRCYAAPIRLDLRDCRPRDVIREAWEQLGPSRRGRDARLVEGGAADLSLVADARRLAQVVCNVLENALDACRDPVTIEVAWSEVQLHGRSAVRIALRDDGPGLTREQHCRLFEPFFTTKTQGTGLGMAIASRLVEAHGGSIEAGRHGGPGAEIVIILPRWPVATRVPRATRAEGTDERQAESLARPVPSGRRMAAPPIRR